MRDSQQHPALSEMTRAQVFWGYINASAMTEAKSSLRLLVAPLRAMQAGSLEPIRVAYRRYMEDGDRVFARYYPSLAQRLAARTAD